MIKNLTEEVVNREYDRLRPQFPHFCGCEICHADVLVFALNRVPAHYVATLQGSVITDVNLDRDQEKVSVDVVLLDGLRKVSQAPRCGRKPQALEKAKG